MKNKSFIAALILTAAVLAPAKATTVLTATLNNATGTYSLTGTGATGTITATGYDGLSSATPPATSGVTSAPLDVSGGGLGLANTVKINNVVTNTTYIGENDFVVLDFSSPPPTTDNGSLQSVNFKLNVEVANSNLNYEIYGINGYTGAKSSLPATLLNGLGGGSLGSTGVANVQITAATFALYSAYVIAVDCPVSVAGGIDVQNVTLTYGGSGTLSTPEPATFLMAGIALIGLGVTMKRRSRKA